MIKCKIVIGVFILDVSLIYESLNIGPIIGGARDPLGAIGQFA
jgi:hypothetical protein